MFLFEGVQTYAHAVVKVFVWLLENSHRVVRRFFANRKKAEEEETLRKEAEAEAAAQIAELDRQLKVILYAFLCEMKGLIGGEGGGGGGC